MWILLPIKLYTDYRRKIKTVNKIVVARRGAHLVAERSGAKWRGRGLGQRNMDFKKKCGINQKFKNLRVLRQSPFARKALCATGRAEPLACAAASLRLRP